MMAADDPVGLIRQSDISRLEKEVHETLTTVQALTTIVTELRLDVAKNYVTKIDLQQSVNDLKQDADTVAVTLATDRKGDASELAMALKEHLASDDARFARLEKMLWWVLGILGSGMLGLIYVLITAAIGHGK